MNPQLTPSRSGPRLCAVLFLLFALTSAFPVAAQDSVVNRATGAMTGQKPREAARDAEQDPETEAPSRVEVEPVARDQEIEARLQRILKATGWFVEPSVRVDEGVVFLGGRTETEQLKKWAGDLARNTQDVVAVVNRIDLMEPSLWDIGPALEELREIWRRFLHALPLIGFGLFVLALAWLAGIGITTLLRRVLGSRRSMTPLLREVLARAGGIIVFLLGLYLVLLVVGLARLAVTVLGGTGLVGLIIGIAFRDITENFLASIFLSLQRPFRTGDLVEIEEVLGLVQRLTIRTTILMTLDGNHVQIPNSTVYKSKIRNFTSNPNRRESFTIGIGYDDSIAEAQQAALEVLGGHPAVLKDPEPWVLVDTLGSATIVLKVYFWLDGTRHSWLKVRSSVIRLIKRSFQERGISMPDEAREVVFPQEIPVRLLGQPGAEPPAEAGAVQGRTGGPVPESSQVATAAEGGLHTEAPEVQEQGRRSRSPEEGENLLD